MIKVSPRLLLNSFLFVILSFVSILNADAGREKVNINRDWKFYLGDVRGAEVPDYDDSRWTDTHLPHSFSIPYFMWKDVYHGYGWYRKEIDMPSDWNGREVILEFEASFIDTEVYLNGKRLGEHVGGYTGFHFDLTPYLTRGKNLLAVRVNNLWSARVAPRTGDHQFSGGIYRDVYLHVTDPLHVDCNGTFFYSTSVTHSFATCASQIDVRNDRSSEVNFKLKTMIYSPGNKLVSRSDTSVSIAAGQTKSLRQTFPPISHPDLWSPETPNLYKAVTVISTGGKEVDSYQTTFGVRSMEWTADKGFFLNGEHYYLLGANVHQDQAGWGDAVTNGAIRRDVRMIKDAGFNCIRGSHYPHDPAFAKACDELGVILFMENCFWGMGGNTDEAAWGKGAPASCYPTKSEDQPSFNQSVLSQLKEEIIIHRNSPSIAAWSLSNEPFFTSGSTDDVMKNLLNLETDSARKWDPSRQVAIGGCQRKGVDRLGKGAIAFYNGDGASRSEFQNPGVPNIVSEYSSTSCNRPGSFTPGWGDLRDGYNRPEWRSGQVIWCGFDHGTVGGTALATMGIIDYFRLPKRAYYWYKQAYKEGKRSPVEPVWPQRGTPARLKLTAGTTTIAANDGTDDAQIIVTVEDANGTHISNNVPVKLQVVSGPGEFPTGTSIQFMPQSSDQSSDIAIRDGQAAIAFRSYYGGKSVIKATADNLSADSITIITQGTPKWEEGVTKPTADRPYKRFTATEKVKSEKSVMTLALNRPTTASSEFKGTNKANANDDNAATLWKPNAGDTDRWWQVALEASYAVNRIELTFPTADVYRYLIQVSEDGTSWKSVVDQSHSDINTIRRVAVGNFGDKIAFVRVKFTSELAGLAEVRVGGSTEAANSK